MNATKTTVRCTRCIPAWVLIGLAILCGASSRAQESAGDRTERALAAQIVGDPTEGEHISAREIHRTAALMLHSGLPSYARALVEFYFAERGNPWTAEAFLLLASSELLRFELGAASVLLESESPAEAVGRQLNGLSGASEELAAGLELLSASVRKGGDSASRLAILRHRLQVCQARVHLAKGDVVYRLQGPSIVGQLAGEAPQHSALAEYTLARNAIYEALLIRRTVDAQLLADQIGQRLAWIRDRRAFGGQGYFELPPYLGKSEKDSVETERGRLGWLVDTGLPEAEGKWAGGRARAIEGIVAIANDLRDQDALSERRRRESVENLTKQIFELRSEIGDREDAAGQALAERFEGLEAMLFESEGAIKELDVALDDRREEIAKITQELADAVQALGDIGREKELQDFAKEAVAELLKGIDEVAGEARKVDQTLRRLLTDGLSGSKSSSIGTACSNLALSAVALRSTTQSNLADAQSQIDELNSKVEEYGQLMETESARIAQNAEREIRARAESLLANGESDILALKEQMLDAAKVGSDELTAAKDRIFNAAVEAYEKQEGKVREQIAAVNGRIADAEGFIEDFQRGAASVEAAILAAQVAISAAATIPNGVIAGMANGVFTSAGDSIIEAAKAGAEVVRHANEVVATIEGAKDRVRRLKDAVEEYERLLGEIGRGAVETALEREFGALASRVEQDGRAFELRIVRMKQDLQDHATAIVDSNMRSVQIEARELAARLSGARAIWQQAEIQLKRAHGDRDRVKLSASRQMGRVELLRARLDELLQSVDQILAAKDRYQSRLSGAPDVRRRLEVEIELQLDGRRAEILQRIEELEAEIARWRKGDYDEAGAVPVEELAALASGPSVGEDLRNYRRLLDEANRKLFTLANWIYSMSGDRQALRWAIDCGSLADVKLVRDKLSEVEGLLRGRARLAQIRPVTVSLRMDELPTGILEAFRSANAIQFTLAPHLALDGGQRPKPVRRIEWPENKHLEHSVDPPLPGSTVIVPSVGLEDGRWLTLLDAFVSPTWTQAAKQKLERNEYRTEVMSFRLETVGPSTRAVAGQLETFPTVIGETREGSFQAFGVAVTPSVDEATWKNKLLEMWRGVNAEDMLHGSAPERSCPLVHGRGLGGIYRLVFPRRWLPEGKSDLPVPGIEELESVEITFLCLMAGVRSGFDSAQYPKFTEVAEVVTSWRAERADPGVFGELLLSYEDELKRAEARGERESYLHSPPARASRLAMLQAAMENLPSYRDVSSGSAAARGAELEGLTVMDRWAMKPSGEQGAAERDLEARLRRIAGEILDGEIMGADTVDAIDTPVRISARWSALRSLLVSSEATDRSSLVSQLNETSRQLGAVRRTLQVASRSYDSLKLFYRRLSTDLRAGTEQVKAYEELVKGLSLTASNESVAAELKNYLRRFADYGDTSRWLQKWIGEGGEESVMLQLYRLDQVLESLRKAWQDHLISVDTPDRKEPGRQGSR